MKKLIVFACVISLLASGIQVSGACPRADVNGDCKVNFEDFAIMAYEWLTEGVPEPDGMTWVHINDSGDGMKDEYGNPISHGGFTGEMSKYEITNAQYCQFLNAALASGDITVIGNTVDGADFVGQVYYNLAGSGNTYDGAINGGAARIDWTGSTFTVGSRFENHPVTYVSWYGAIAFCNYYGYRLPTEWEWQAVADYDGEFTYGCGTSINNSIANYYGSTHPYGTTAVGSFGNSLGYGYGMCDMAGSLSEWTSTTYISPFDGLEYRIVRGGSWSSPDGFCTVSYWHYDLPNYGGPFIGFRVCQN